MKKKLEMLGQDSTKRLIVQGVSDREENQSH